MLILKHKTFFIVCLTIFLVSAFNFINKLTLLTDIKRMIFMDTKYRNNHHQPHKNSIKPNHQTPKTLSSHLMQSISKNDNQIKHKQVAESKTNEQNQNGFVNQLKANQNEPTKFILPKVILNKKLHKEANLEQMVPLLSKKNHKKVTTTATMTTATTSTTTKIANKNFTIFCIILSYEDNLNRGKQIANTWAKKCDNFKLITIIPRVFLDMQQIKTVKKNKKPLEIDYLNMFQPPDILYEKNTTGNSYNLTHKVYQSFKHIYLMYPHYDWYLKADDDSFVFVDNLREFLKDKDAQSPVTYGYDFKKTPEDRYHSGGASYVLSHEAMTRLGSKLKSDPEFCPSTGVEDKNVAACLRKLQVYSNKSLDDLGRERFHPFSINAYFNLPYDKPFPKWTYNLASNPPVKGPDCCSDTTISFHYMNYESIQLVNDLIEKKPSLIRNMSALYEMLPKKKPSSQIVNKDKDKKKKTKTKRNN